MRGIGPWESAQSSNLSFRLYGPRKLEIIKSCFTSQECIPVKILYIFSLAYFAWKNT